MALQQAAFGFTKKLYAFRPDTMVVHERPAAYKSTQKVYLTAVKYVSMGRRTATKRRAVFIGTEVVRSDSPPADFDEFLTRVRGISPGQIIWDGEEVWGVTKLKDMNEAAEFGDPVLKSAPDLPAGWSGWWEEV